MRGINKVILLGNVSRLPVVTQVTGMPMRVLFELVTKRSGLDAKGQRCELLETHKILCYGRLAEIIGSYVEKGRPLYLEGSLITIQLPGEDGALKDTTLVQADTLQLLNAGKEVPLIVTEETA